MDYKRSAAIAIQGMIIGAEIDSGIRHRRTCGPIRLNGEIIHVARVWSHWVLGSVLFGIRIEVGTRRCKS